MKQKFYFDTTAATMVIVAVALIIICFMDNDSSRNIFAGITLFVCILLFSGAILLRAVTDRIG
ncbi:DUF423 domain-containing protein [Mucilaginibacter sp.]|uniref:DUF423 domain-containing protein n=1 Tax=Mucilaginibacter sp. TaxID=1882438 RepID=UPI002629C9A0|nr:DUF423 domain-containing protein [Mucilaginibacter sp.]MDB5031740.1 hypothetical protein [Mucilaginibacter sp.]